jgi:hypothetical protein
MIIIEDQEHLDKVREFARSVGAEAELQKQLDFLGGFGGDAANVLSPLPITAQLLLAAGAQLTGRLETRAGRRPDLFRPRYSKRRLRALVQRQPQPRCGQRLQASVVHPHLSQTIWLPCARD